MLHFEAYYMKVILYNMVFMFKFYTIKSTVYQLMVILSINVLDLVTSDDEISNFKRRSERKIRDVFRVLKKVTVVEMVTEYRIVDDVVQTKI